MKRIRILHLAQCAGGVDCYLRMLLSNMDREQFSNVLVCSHDYNKSDYEGIVDEFIQIDMQNALSFSKDFSAVKTVRKLIKSLKPDIIYCHSSKAGGIGRIANIGTDIPLIYNPHGWAFCLVNSNIKSVIYLWLERVLSLFTTKFITISNYKKLVAVQKHIAKPSRIKTIFNGIDMDAVNRQLTENHITKESLGIPDGACIIGMVGRISAQKSPDTFVKMAVNVKEKIPNAWFMIVGDGDQRNDIEQLIADYGLKNCFTITGWVDNPLTYTNLFDIAVLLSRWEGFGLVLAEYMKLGKPIVATETNAIPDLITDHENGLLVEVDNHEQAAQAILEIYNNENLRNNMIQKGEMRANAFFDIRRTAMEHERLFVNICKRVGVKCNIFIYVICPTSNKVWRAAA